MSLWDWTLEAYGLAGVPEATLALQDTHGQNTAFLLWAVWAEGPAPEALGQAAAAAKAWDATVLLPIRQVRRALKLSQPPVDDGARQGLREDIKAAELRAERVLMETLEGLAGASSGGHGALASLQAASAAWGKPAPDDALAVLARALS
ncbi:MAG: TIGR02444 family protein [Phenylobacterium sp.]|uniref:TIGR02444 family protein n=1 Tax=Phenylobacterium sp. TaxID=1871053 RepID=UPI001B3EA094|nr:TIGR02444 family protein [Phenylobacterium sp.]MBP7650739.1 TIGR02444 family protein [Phenylobacterium sp.]MBP7816499.1 TIGR02444 family protein [Phenylobacterium sp.]MBP9232275.1 TIGR02444 family protein [Phenylobacterium sp.]MBP9754090.1 TIGR02444 family protein [Phenylobacterium sp.]